MEKDYDWIMSNMANPKFNGVDFRVVGNMTVDNTQFMDYDYYVKAPRIRDSLMFKDKNGLFDESLFRPFYILAILKYRDFADESIVDNYEYSPFNLDRPLHALVKQENFLMYALANPTHTTIGVSNFNAVGDSGLSMRELALLSEIVDGKTGKGLGYSVNDMALFGGSFGKFLKRTFGGDPLVYATYDEDTEEFDPYSGNMVKHLKGEYKVNSDGQFYTETLAGRDLLGKDVVSMFDYLTVDGSLINRYDFFDADGLTKNTGATVMRSLVTLLPLINPTTGLIYSTILLTKAVAEIAPMLYGVVTGLVGAENVSTPVLDTISAWGKKFSLSQSDYDRMNTFTWNNVVNLAGDLGTIFASLGLLVRGISSLRGSATKVMRTAELNAVKEYQRMVDEGIKKLGTSGADAEFILKSGVGKLAYFTGEKDNIIASGRWASTPYGQAAIAKYIPDALKLVASYQLAGLNASLVYFAMSLNTGLYDELRMRGVDPREAALITLGSMAATFAVDKYLKLGTMFFLLPESEVALRAVAKESAEGMMLKLKGKVPKATSRKAKINFLNKGIEMGTNALRKFADGLKNNSLSTAGKAFGEGLMRSSEELVHDISRSIASLLGEMGYFKETDYGEWENLLDRYGMTYLGGALGGAAFDVIGKMKMTKNNANNLTHSAIYMIRNGRKDDLLKAYKDMYDNGELGSKTLSSKMDPEGKNAFTVTSEKDSLAYFIYSMLVNSVNNLEAILNRYGVNLSDLEATVRSGFVALSLMDYLNGNGEAIQEAMYFTNYYDDFLNLCNRIVALEDKINKLMGLYPDSARSSEAFKSAYEPLKAQLDELIKLRDYLFGEGSLGYAEEMLFAIDPMVFGSFGNINFSLFARMTLGKAVENLTPAEKTDLLAKFDKNKSSDDRGIHDKFIEYKRAEKLLTPEITLMSDAIGRLATQDEVKSARDTYRRDAIGLDTLLDGETEEEYNMRNTPMPTETMREYNIRREARIKHIDDYNGLIILRIVDQLADKYLTTDDRRMLEQTFYLTTKLIENDFINRYINLSDVELRKLILAALAGKSNDYNALARKIGLTLKEYYTGAEEVKYGKPSSYEDLFYDAVNAYLRRTTPEGMPVRARYITNADVLHMIEPDEHKFSNDLAMDVQRRMANFATEYPMLFDETPQGQRNIAARDFAIEAILAYANGDLEAYRRLMSSDRARLAAFITSEALDNEAEAMTGTFDLESRVGSGMLQDVMNRIIDMDWALLDSLLYKALQGFERLLFVKSPIVDMMSRVTRTLNELEYNVSKLLSDIHELDKNTSDQRAFLLTTDQENALTMFINDLHAISVYFNAAKTGVPETENSIGHNEAINNFINENREKYPNAEFLPTIPHAQWQVVENEILNYTDLMRLWLDRSLLNHKNKQTSITNSNKAIDKTRLLFWNTHKDAFVIRDNDMNVVVDLMKDVIFPTTTDPTFEDIVKIENQVLKNFIEAYNNDNSVFTTMLDYLLAEGSAHRMISSKGMLGIVNQRTAVLDDRLEYANLTDYDKVAYLITTIAVDNNAFYDRVLRYYQVDSVDKDGKSTIIPSRALEYVAKMAYAERHSSFVSQYIDYVYNHTDIKLPKGKYMTIITGAAGTGKSRVGAGINVENGDRVLLCAPLETLVKNLETAVEKNGATITEFSHLGLLEFILSDKKNVATFMKPVERARGSGLYNTKQIGLDSNNTISMELKSDDMAELKDRGGTLIVDEATWFNTAEVALMGEFGEKNNVHTILLGDTYQNGFEVHNLIHNIDREVIFSWRTPKLNTSLRAGYSQKVRNLDAITNIIDVIDNTSTVEELSNIARPLVDPMLSNFSLRRFESQDGKLFIGDYIVPSLTDEMINAIPTSSTIGFIGSAGSPTLATLKNKFGAAVSSYLPLDVQGLEFDYVVIEKDWNVNMREDNADRMRDVYSLFKDVYTMTTRSRNGSIIISDKLETIIKNGLDTETALLGDLSEIAAKLGPVRIEELSRVLAGKTTTAASKPPTKPMTSELGSPAPPKAATTPAEVPLSEKTPESTEADMAKTIVDATTPVPDDMTETTDENASLGSYYVTGLPLTQNSAELAHIVEWSLLMLDAIMQDQIVRYRLVQNAATPVRVYGNIHMSGIDINLNVWLPSGTHSDLDIFLEEGQSASTDEAKLAIKDGLIKLKSALMYRYNGNVVQAWFQRMVDSNKVLAHRFSINDLNNAVYVIRSTEASALNDLIGPTDLDSSEAARKIGNGGRVVTLSMKISGLDNNGHKLDYYVTLGAFANPDTWSRGENVTKIHDALERIRGSVADDSPEAYYYDNFWNITDRYNQFIDDFTLNDNEFEIDPSAGDISLGTMTMLYRRNENLRLLSADGESSPYSSESLHGVRSPVYIIRDAAKLGVNEKLSGRAVMYVSSNGNLESGELMELYEQQKAHDPTSVQGMVRMIVLDNVGISFSLLCDLRIHQKYAVDRKGKVHLVPVEYGPTGVRMYLSMWNFRAALHGFTERYEGWRDNVMHMTDKEINQICAMENELYNSVQELLGREAVSFEEFQLTLRQRATDTTTDYPLRLTDLELLEALWKFNNEDLNGVRWFRLGKATNNTGSYIRRLIGVESLPEYEDYRGRNGIPAKRINGVYISYAMADQYRSVMDGVFEELIDKLIPAPLGRDFTKTTYLDTHMKRLFDEIQESTPALKKARDNWYNNLRHKQVLTLQKPVYDENGDMIDEGITITVNSGDYLTDRFRLLAISMIHLGENMYYYTRYGKKNPHGDFKVLDINGKEMPVDWMNINNRFTRVEDGVTKTGLAMSVLNGIYDEYDTGFSFWKTNPDGIKEGMRDYRWDNMCSLMFHGLTSTRIAGDFGGDEPRAADAYFKYGFMSDPIVADLPKDDPTFNSARLNMPSTTNESLYTSNVVPGFPMIGVTENIYNIWADVKSGRRTALLPPKTAAIEVEATTPLPTHTEDGTPTGAMIRPLTGHTIALDVNTLIASVTGTLFAVNERMTWPLIVDVANNELRIHALNLVYSERLDDIRRVPVMYDEAGEHMLPYCFDEKHSMTADDIATIERGSNDNDIIVTMLPSGDTTKIQRRFRVEFNDDEINIKEDMPLDVERNGITTSDELGAVRSAYDSVQVRNEILSILLDNNISVNSLLENARTMLDDLQRLRDLTPDDLESKKGLLLVALNDLAMNGTIDLTSYNDALSRIINIKDTLC